MVSSPDIQEYNDKMNHTQICIHISNYNKIGYVDGVFCYSGMVNYDTPRQHLNFSWTDI